MLRLCQYSVTSCTSGTSAVALLRSHPDNFDLVLCDVMMPDMDGFKLLEVCRKEKVLGRGATCATRRSCCRCDARASCWGCDAKRSCLRCAARRNEKKEKRTNGMERMHSGKCQKQGRGRGEWNGDGWASDLKGIRLGRVT
eukprot:1158402-Pelagomonas_calceolata.AAC.18